MLNQRTTRVVTASAVAWRRRNSMRRDIVLNRTVILMIILAMALPGAQTLNGISLAASPELTLTPNAGRPGKSVTARGNHFPPRTKGRILWEADGTGLATFRTSRSGKFSTRFRIPEASAGTVLIVAEVGELRVETSLLIEETEPLAVTPRPTETTIPATELPSPTATPTDDPTATPTDDPTATPTDDPTATPTDDPTATPTDDPTATPTDDSIAPNITATGGGLTGRYFDNQNFTTLKVTRIDPVVDFAWGNGAPDPAIAPDSFSVRWTGRVLADRSETYTFCVTSNDGARLRVDGKLLVDRWRNQAATEYCGTIALRTGTWYALELEYYEGAKTATVRLTYASPGTSKRVIPSDHLAPDDGIASTPTLTPTPTRTPTPKPTPTRTPTPTATPANSTGCTTTLQNLVNAAPSGAVV
jgi:hypothetical protein